MSGSLGGKQMSGAVIRMLRRGTDIAQMEKKEGAAFLRLGDVIRLVREGCECWVWPCILDMFTTSLVYVPDAALRFCNTRSVNEETTKRGVI